MDGLYRWDMETFRADQPRPPLPPARRVVFLALSFTGLGGWEALFADHCLYPWPRLRRFIVPLLATDAFSGFLIADGIKQLVHRDRPSFLRFAVVQERRPPSDSFVSGHTTTAFACADDGPAS